MENIKYNSKNLEEKKLYENNKYIKYNSNANLQAWLLKKAYECKSCNKTMHYSSKYRHLKTLTHLKKEDEIKKIVYSS